MRYLLEISYKGTNYHGWQIQKNALTVQQEVNRALETLVLKPVSTLGSGRTDTGVHALQQFAHFDSDTIINLQKFIFQLNAILPKDIFIKSLTQVDSNFNARHDAKSRSYQYRISTTKNPFLEDVCCFYFQRNIDMDLLNLCAKIILQNTDFQSFSKYKTDVNHFECTIFDAIWHQQHELITFEISANRFLRGMVRALVGTMLEVGIGKLSITDFENIIKKKDRCAAKYAAPPQGLFLTKVQY